MELTFERWENGQWFVVLPEYDGPQEDLEMVENADNMLAALSDDGLYVTLKVNTEIPLEGYEFSLDLEAHDEIGAHYRVNQCERFEGVVWLCNVVHDVFGEHPEKIYCSLI
ncbi:MAG: hypothetical protein K2M10_05010 [Muribaculaceae bacterium]|nr:hypothetical protein [Muribaculaceae bacterium]MDE6298986.1 hypothetical protein [Muribaculaceae bacterium]